MPLSAKTIKTQLSILKPVLSGRKLKTIRLGQNKIGELMELRHRADVIIKKHAFEKMDRGWFWSREQF